MNFIKNKLYNRRQLHDQYGGNRQNGISNCKGHPIIFIFTGSSGEQYGYEDGWDSEGYFRYTGEGQIEPSGVLPVAKTVGSKGFLVVRILLDDQEQAKELPLGGAGTVAIYTQVGGPFHVISKIALRMKSWIYYAPL